MENLKSTNPKEYWKIFNNSTTTKKMEAPSEAMLDSFVKHFEKLGNDPDADREPPVDNNGVENPVLNSDFTEEEVEHSLKKLKKQHGSWQ